MIKRLILISLKLSFEFCLNVHLINRLLFCLARMYFSLRFTIKLQTLFINGFLPLLILSIISLLYHLFFFFFKRISINSALIDICSFPFWVNFLTIIIILIWTNAFRLIFVSLGKDYWNFIIIRTNMSIKFFCNYVLYNTFLCRWF